MLFHKLQKLQSNIYFISFSVHVVVAIGQQLKGGHSHPKIKIKIINLNLEISNTCIMK